MTMGDTGDERSGANQPSARIDIEAVRSIVVDSLRVLSGRSEYSWKDRDYIILVDVVVVALTHRPTVDELASDLRELMITEFKVPSPEGCDATARALLALIG